MEYLTTVEMSKRWNISSRRIGVLCTEGRVEGAMLDSFRYLCKGKTEPDKALCAAFNEETQDGRNMSKYSELLGDSIASIIEVKDENDMDSFLSGKQMSFLSETINGLDDFELISFLVIK